jgi:hypothetical protein
MGEGAGLSDFSGADFKNSIDRRLRRYSHYEKVLTSLFMKKREVKGELS